MRSSKCPLELLLLRRQIKGGETSTYLMMPIVSTLDRGEFTVKLKAFSSQREDYEEIPIRIEVSHRAGFYPRDAILVPVLALCLCLSQVGVLSKRLNESGWFLLRELLSTYLALCFKEIQVP